MREVVADRGEASAERILRLLEVSGELSLLGQAGAGGSGDSSTIDRNAIARALATIDPEELSEASEKAVALADDLVEAEGVERAGIERQILAAVSLRTRSELLVEGTMVLLGAPPELPADFRAAVLAFDEVLRPELWRHLPMNEWRASAALSFAPQHRSRLWWLHRGADLPADALDALGTTARLIHLFPEARQELERLIAAEKQLERMRESGKQGAVVSLAEHLERRRARAARGRGEELPLGVIRFAAADITTETVICERPEATLSVTRDHFIVDLERPAAAEEEPVVRLEVEGQPPLDARPTEPGRFEFPLDAEQLRASSASLRIALAGGVLVISLPLDDD